MYRTRIERYHTNGELGALAMSCGTCTYNWCPAPCHRPPSLPELECEDPETPGAAAARGDKYPRVATRADCILARGTAPLRKNAEIDAHCIDQVRCIRYSGAGAGCPTPLLGQPNIGPVQPRRGHRSGERARHIASDSER